MVGKTTGLERVGSVDMTLQWTNQIIFLLVMGAETNAITENVQHYPLMRNSAIFWRVTANMRGPIHITQPRSSNG